MPDDTYYFITRHLTLLGSPGLVFLSASSTLRDIEMLLLSFTVEHRQKHDTLASFLRQKMALPWSKAKHLVENGQVRVASRSTRDPAQRLKVGQKVEIHGHSEIATPVSKPKLSNPPPKPKRAYSGPMPEIVYSDDAIVVVNKPAGLTTMRHAEEAEEFGERGKRYLPDTLADLLPSLLGTPDRRVRAVHRIDKETSGLVVFARTSAAEKHLTEQFRAHSVERRYLAIVRGVLVDGRIEFPPRPRPWRRPPRQRPVRPWSAHRDTLQGAGIIWWIRTDRMPPGDGKDPPGPHPPRRSRYSALR